MLGAIAGDIIGSVYEWNNIKTTDFPLFSDDCYFTDDTVLTVAVADCILHGLDYVSTFKKYASLYPDAGYGSTFSRWIMSKNSEPYNSWGNGSAMRVSPIGYAFNTLEETLINARRSAEVTHNHPEGIKGAQATASAIYLARTGKSKDEIRDYITSNFGYVLSESIESIRKWYKYDVSCQGTVPPAIVAFLESKDFEDAIRKAISVGGDSDTLACITGSIAHAYYGEIPKHIRTKVLEILDDRLRIITLEFMERFRVKF